MSGSSTLLEKISFDDFYSANYARLVNYAKRYVDRHSLAEEVVQEAFGVLWSRWDEVETPENFVTRIISNKCRDVLRRRKVAEEKWDRLEYKPIHNDDGLYLLDSLQKISRKRREAIFLRFYEDQTTGQIADRMDIPQGTAKSILHRALAQLRLEIA